MADALVLKQQSDGIATLTLNDPARLNVLSSAMISALSGALKSIAEDTSIKVVLLKANGRAFCAGHDLAELTRTESQGRADFEKLFQHCTALMLLIRDIPQTVIALVNGIATAAGTQLVATCDIALADPSARFGLNGIDVGLFCSTPMVAATRNMLPKRCYEMLVSGQFLTAQDAADAGLITRVTDAGALQAEGNALAERIAEKEGSALALGKQAFYRQRDLAIEQAYQVGQSAILDNLDLDETQARIRSFGEKRQKPTAN